MASSSNADNSFAHEEVQVYPFPSHVNTANFLSIKLSGKANYRSWQEQMRCLLDSHDMLSFIYGPLRYNQGNREWERSDTLVKGWIFGSLTEDVMDTVVGLHTSHQIWERLVNNYDILAAPTSNAVCNQANFPSIKLSGKANYRSWHEQMTCLLDRHDMLGFIDGTIKCNQGNREWKRSDTLVKGWIFSSLTEDVKDTVVGLHTSHQVWERLVNNYDILAAPTSNAVSNQDSTHSSEYGPLYEAIVDGDWETAQEYFNKDKAALIAKINDDDDSPLHVAIDTLNVKIVENLLDEIKPELLPTLVCKRGQNPLHRAAQIGITYFAKMLVTKNPNLLFLCDKEGLLPIHSVIFGAHLSTFWYLLEVTKKHLSLAQQEGHENPFQGSNAAVPLKKIIRNGLFEYAYELIKDYPEMARRREDFYSLLKSIAGNLDAYLSGTKYNFYQNFVYNRVPIPDYYQDNAYEIDQDIENQALDTSIAKCWRSCFQPVIQWIYVKLWKALLHVPHVKRLQEHKSKHKKTLLLLKCICKEHQEIVKESEHHQHYREAVLFALENDTPEAIQEIIKSFPHAIWTKQNDLNLIQLSIVNRCENIYNFLVDEPEIDKLVHKILDEDGNNILHLAGKLAPIHRLNRVSGAALQMQRELQWFKEVKEIALPKYSIKKNKKQETPMMVFRREHKELRKEGEEWMKTTANSYTITAALIITIVFAAAITVPGGNDDNTGKPIYATDPGFIIFVVSDAISLFTSTTSLLLCLSILTTNYRDEDFLYRLPKRLILGLGMLFISVTSMMIAFSATLYIMFAQGKAWILFPIAALACLPIISFVTLQLPLLFELYSSTYGQGIFGKRNDGKIKSIINKARRNINYRLWRMRWRMRRYMARWWHRAKMIVT